MDIARGDLFARPRRAAQHHPTVRFRDLVKLPHQRFEGGRAADHISARDLAPFEAVVLATQARGFHRAADHHHQLVDIEGFFDEVIGTLLDRRDRDFDVPMPRDDDNRHIRIVPLYRFQNVDPVHPAVFQPDIKDHQRRRFRVDGRDRLVRIAGQPRDKALVFQNVRNQLADVAFVVNDQDVTHYGSPVLGFRWGQQGVA